MKLKIFSLVIFSLSLFAFYFNCKGQAGEWVWINGDTTSLNNGSYGTQGISSSTNHPPPMYEPCEWTDLNGNFWLYGGLKPGCIGFCVYNDLWKYNPVINEWTWMKGTGIPNDSIGNYGIQGVATMSNQPPCLSWGTKSWTDLNGNLWMFGGEDNNSTTSHQGFSDLWKYDIPSNMWTWIKGPGIPDQPGIYGTKGIPNIANNPACSAESAMSWTSNSGDLYQLEETSNVLWKYNISTNMWTWVKGTPFPSVINFGNFQVEDSLTSSSYGDLYSKWKDNNGNFWMFDAAGLMWRYNVVTNNWTWMNGDTAFNGYCYRDYGDKCVSLSLNAPGGRHENRAAWKDNNGNFWMYGGWVYVCGGLSDLWMYKLATNQWTWAGGDSSIILSPNTNYGTLGVSSPMNNPGNKEGSIGWADANGHLYLFGGEALGYSWYSGALWKFTIDTTCITGINEVTNQSYQLEIYPNPCSSYFNLSMEINTKQNIEIIIYNTLGEDVYSFMEENIIGKFAKQIEVQKLNNGIYFLQVKLKNKTINKKFLKQ